MFLLIINKCGVKYVKPFSAEFYTQFYSLNSIEKEHRKYTGKYTMWNTLHANLFYQCSKAKVIDYNV